MLLIAPVTGVAETWCDLTEPGMDAGENQAHGVILYIYPRDSQITSDFTGCQSTWFYDEDHFRKLDIVRIEHGRRVAYDKLRIDGQLAYRCRYKGGQPAGDNDGRCPAFEMLERSSYRSGCHSLSYLNESDSYNLAFDDCILD